VTRSDLLNLLKNTFLPGSRQETVAFYARQVLEDPASEEAWLGLGLSLEEKEKRIYCLNRVLELNPHNQAARRVLDELEAQSTGISNIQPVHRIPGQVFPTGDTVTSPASAADKPIHNHPSSPIHNINWPLLLGFILVGFILLVSIFGPSWSPHDPMQENYTLMVDEKIRIPPYPPFKIDGYMLGTDNFGRDLWSRILWGVRPTMIMVGVVALIRLVVGTVLGMVIGWSQGRMKRFMDSLLSSTLSVPVLIVAIIGIYLVGTQKGLLAFIVGLGLTGWAETARLVSDQTQLIKKQVFIDAVRSLGASERYILFVHVLRHIFPLLWMLLAFEMSSTLLVSAELGFLGYYIGGGVYVEISDFVAVNTAGLPELGQLLSSALTKLTDPSALIVVGTAIFIGVLGFNLLGEGLRRETGIENQKNRQAFGLLPQDWGDWLENHVLAPASDWFNDHRIFKWVVPCLFILSLGLFLIGKFVYIPKVDSQKILLEVPGDHLWASERHDPYGTKWVPVSITSKPEVVWSVPIPGGPSGGPAVNAEGIVYIAGLDQFLLAIDPTGVILWQVSLPALPVGGPALDGLGNIYVADYGGGVTAVSPEGTVLWHTQASSVREATAGPIVSPSGMIYVTIIDTVAALSPGGELVWRVGAADIYAEIPPRLSARQDMIFLWNSALAATSGTRQDLQLVPENQILAKDPAYFTGADGLDYYRVGHAIMDWHLGESGGEVGSSRTWLYQSSVIFNPYDQGVTPAGLGWLYYTTQYSDSRMVWLDEKSRVVGNYLFPRVDATLVAIGEEDEAYLCGATGARVECINIAVTQQEPTWSITIDVPTDVAGGALVPGRLYVALEYDSLYALEPPK
jgi:ABC-type dipeptide/oligopeptide/nickel transport system permease subunit